MRLFNRANNRAAWSEDDLAILRQMIGLELPMRDIARKLHRSEEAVRQKAHRIAMADMIAMPVASNSLSSRAFNSN
jgi:hypothetical protein